jgi:type I restriction enzyme S subunit
MTKGWEKKTIGDMCEVIAGQSPEGKFYNSDGRGMPFYQGKKDFGEKFIEKPTTWTTETTKIAREGDILISVRAPVGPVNFATEEVCIGRGLAAIRSRKELDRDFLFYQLLHLQPEIAGKEGAVFASINKSEIEALPIAVASLVEQQRIVGVLDEAYAGLAIAQANAEKNLQNARELFESHLQSVFTQRGEGWVDRQLASLCREITVGHVGSMKTEYKESGIPFLRSQNIRPFAVSMDNAMFIDEKFHRALKKSQLRPGDLAIVRTGYPGTAAVIPSELPDSNCSDLVIVRPGEQVNPHFLAAFFNSAFGKQLVLGKIVGAAQKHFNITAAKEVMLHVPPMHAQITIVREVDLLRIETQRLEGLYQQKQAALEALKKSLLHQAFSGQLDAAA